MRENDRTSMELEYAEEIQQHFMRCGGSFSQKMQSFTRFVSRQQQSIYLYKWELYKRIANVHGSIAEFGVYMGSGLFSFASFSSIIEPYNYQRKIIGFDTFTGFPAISENDLRTEKHSDKLIEGGFHVSDSLYDDLTDCTKIFDMNRPLGHIQKIELVQGDILESLPAYLDKNPHSLFSMIYLDLDLYEPTKFVLETLYDRVVSGGVIAFDELNNSKWPGETQAFLEFFKGKSCKLEKLPFEPLRCFFVKE